MKKIIAAMIILLLMTGCGLLQTVQPEDFDHRDGRYVIHRNRHRDNSGQRDDHSGHDCRR